MIAALLVLLATAPPEEATVKLAPAAAVVQLPPLEGGSQVGAPNALPPVTAQLFHIGGRFEVQPLFTFSMGDPFWRTVGMGVRVEQHLDERWSIAVHTLGGLSMVAAPVDICGDSACSSPAAEKLRAAPGKLQLLVGVELGWAPVYGKLSLFGGHTLHFDAYVSVGPEIVLERIAPDVASPEQGRWAAGGRVAIGERLFFTDRFMIRAAVSELVYSGRVRGQSEIERKLSFEGGVAWLFGGR
jgi:outer membrane beta-barrel protein